MIYWTATNVEGKCQPSRLQLLLISPQEKVADKSKTLLLAAGFVKRDF